MERLTLERDVIQIRFHGRHLRNGEEFSLVTWLDREMLIAYEREPRELISMKIAECLRVFELSHVIFEWVEVGGERRYLDGLGRGLKDFL